jgi:hypothetical protein
MLGRVAPGWLGAALEDGMPSATRAALPLVVLCGCADLEGRWKGDVDCGEAGAVDMKLDIDRTGKRTYNGDGSIVGLSLQGVEAAVEVDLDMKQTAGMGAQKVKVFADCVLYIAGQNPQKLDCAGFDELGWDGADKLRARVDDYMGTGYTCTIALNR